MGRDQLAISPNFIHQRLLEGGRKGHRGKAGQNPDGRGEGVHKSLAGPAVAQVLLNGGQFLGRQVLFQIVRRQLSRVYAVHFIGVENLHNRSKQHHRFKQRYTWGLFLGYARPGGNRPLRQCSTSRLQHRNWESDTPQSVCHDLRSRPAVNESLLVGFQLHAALVCYQWSGQHADGLGRHVRPSCPKRAVTKLYLLDAECAWRMRSSDRAEGDGSPGCA